MPCRLDASDGKRSFRRNDMSDKCDALVIFGATGDLAKLETFPALVGLVERGVLDFPVVGVAKSGWGLEQFRDYAVASLKLNKMDPSTPAATKMVSLLRYVDGDLDDDATYQAMSEAAGPGKELLFYFEVPAVRLRPGQLDQAQRDDAPVLRRRGHLPGRRLARVRAGGERPVRPVRQRDR